MSYLPASRAEWVSLAMFICASRDEISLTDRAGQRHGNIHTHHKHKYAVCVSYLPASGAEWLVGRCVCRDSFNYRECTAETARGLSALRHTGGRADCKTLRGPV